VVYLQFHRIFERKHFAYVITEMVWSNFDPALRLAEIDDELNYHQNNKLMDWLALLQVRYPQGQVRYISQVKV
jgi:hypothetical protein